MSGTPSTTLKFLKTELEESDLFLNSADKFFSDGNFSMAVANEDLAKETLDDLTTDFYSKLEGSIYEQSYKIEEVVARDEFVKLKRFGIDKCAIKHQDLNKRIRYKTYKSALNALTDSPRKTIAFSILVRVMEEVYTYTVVKRNFEKFLKKVEVYNSDTFIEKMELPELFGSLFKSEIKAAINSLKPHNKLILKQGLPDLVQKIQNNHTR